MHQEIVISGFGGQGTFNSPGEPVHMSDVVRAIEAARGTGALARTATLADLIAEAIPARDRHASRIHPATRTFQGIRMVVNDELGAIERQVAAARGERREQCVERRLRRERREQERAALAPWDARQVVVDALNPSVGQAAPVPVQDSATSHTPTAARHGVPAWHHHPRREVHRQRECRSRRRWVRRCARAGHRIRAAARSRSSSVRTPRSFVC